MVAILAILLVSKHHHFSHMLEWNCIRNTSRCGRIQPSIKLDIFSFYKCCSYVPSMYLAVNYLTALLHAQHLFGCKK